MPRPRQYARARHACGASKRLLRLARRGHTVHARVARHAPPKRCACVPQPLTCGSLRACVHVLGGREGKVSGGTKSECIHAAGGGRGQLPAHTPAATHAHARGIHTCQQKEGEVRAVAHEMNCSSAPGGAAATRAAARWGAGAEQNSSHATVAATAPATHPRDARVPTVAPAAAAPGCCCHAAEESTRRHAAAHETSRSE